MSSILMFEDLSFLQSAATRKLAGRDHVTMDERTSDFLVHSSKPRVCHSASGRSRKSVMYVCQMVVVRAVERRDAASRSLLVTSLFPRSLEMGSI